MLIDVWEENHIFFLLHGLCIKNKTFGGFKINFRPFLQRQILHIRCASDVIDAHRFGRLC